MVSKRVESEGNALREHIKASGKAYHNQLSSSISIFLSMYSSSTTYQHTPIVTIYDYEVKPTMFQAAKYPTDARTLEVHDLHVQWMPTKASTVVVYTTWIVCALFYYALCFFHQFGQIPLPYDQWAYRLLTENALIRVTFIQWLIAVCVVIGGIIKTKGIPMPTYLISSIISMNGTVCLLLINIRKIYIGRMGLDAIYFQLLLVLTLLGVLNTVVHSVALHTHIRERREVRLSIRQLAAQRVLKQQQQNRGSVYEPHHMFAHMV